MEISKSNLHVNVTVESRIIFFCKTVTSYWLSKKLFFFSEIHWSFSLGNCFYNFMKSWDHFFSISKRHWIVNSNINKCVLYVMSCTQLLNAYVHYITDFKGYRLYFGSWFGARWCPWRYQRIHRLITLHVDHWDQISKEFNLWLDTIVSYAHQRLRTKKSVQINNTCFFKCVTSVMMNTSF